jgi:hypothetical protein
MSLGKPKLVMAITATVKKAKVIFSDPRRKINNLMVGNASIAAR